MGTRPQGRKVSFRPVNTARNRSMEPPKRAFRRLSAESASGVGVVAVGVNG